MNSVNKSKCRNFHAHHFHLLLFHWLFPLFGENWLCGLLVLRSVNDYYSLHILYTIIRSMDICFSSSFFCCCFPLVTDTCPGYLLFALSSAAVSRKSIYIDLSIGKVHLMPIQFYSLNINWIEKMAHCVWKSIWSIYPKTHTHTHAVDSSSENMLVKQLK